MPHPKAPRAPKPPRPWQRVTPGRYRSSDGRFTIDQGGAGRWFLVDAEARDELGLARTLGPFQTLDEARIGAEVQRSTSATESPLRARLSHADSSPTGRARAAGRTPSRAAAGAPSSGPAPPPKPTWLDRLSADDQRRARGWIEALERLGITQAEQIVRRDLDGDVPAVATAMLAHELARTALRPPEDREPARLARRLERAGARSEDIRAYAHAVAADVLGRLISVLTDRRRDPGVPSRLPGWHLTEGSENGGRGRRLIISSEDVIRSDRAFADQD